MYCQICSEGIVTVKSLFKKHRARKMCTVIGTLDVLCVIHCTEGFCRQ